MDYVPTNAERSHPNETKECGEDQIEGNRWDNAKQLHWHPGDDETKIVIIYITTSEPRIVRWENGTFNDCVQVREIHRFLSHLPCLPEIGISQSNQKEEQEKY